MTADPGRVTKRDNLQAVANRVAATGAPQAPLYAAAAAGRIGLIVMEHHDAEWVAGLVTQPRRPIITLLNGDPGWGEQSYGPTRWRCSRKLKAWAVAAVIHGAAGEADHYRDAVVMAEMFGRLAFIETTSSLARSWAAFLAPVPWTGYLPIEGAHPVAPTVTQ